MSVFATGADAVFGVLAAALLHGTLLALAAMLLSATVLRRARPGVIAALWTVVLLKFLVPVGPGARFSVASLVDSVRGDTLPDEFAVLSPSIATARPANPAAETVSWGALALACGWLLGAALVAVRHQRASARARMMARQAQLAPTWLVDEVANLAQRIGVRRRRRIEVRVANHAVSPYLVGMLAPIVVVPEIALRDDQANPRRAALAHELAHIRRGDAGLHMLQVAAATLFFFWPIVRWVNRRLDLAREQACDAYAIAVGPLDAAAYAHMLVDVARIRMAAPSAGLALARRGQLRRRVESLLTHPARATRAGIGRPGAALVGAWALVGLTGAASSAPPVASAVTVCMFTPEVALSILTAHPEADADRDGALSRDEVCDFQLILRRRYAEAPGTSSPLELGGGQVLDARVGDAMAVSALASEELCCNCPNPAAGGAAVSFTTGDSVVARTVIPTCVRGVE